MCGKALPWSSNNGVGIFLCYYVIIIFKSAVEVNVSIAVRKSMFKILDFFFPFYRYLNYSLEIISLLHNHGIKPVMVFDEYKLDAKHSVHESRSQ